MSHPDLPDRLVTRSLELTELMDSDFDEMWNLYAKYYGGTSEEQFRSDLSTKTHVLICHDSVGRIGGFSTIEVAEHEFRDEKVGILFPETPSSGMSSGVATIWRSAGSTLPPGKRFDTRIGLSSGYSSSRGTGPTATSECLERDTIRLRTARLRRDTRP